MKARHIITALAISASAVCFAQSADERIGEIINRADWFALEEEYPALKDSMQADFLKLMAEMMTGYCFNRPDDAIRSISHFISTQATAQPHCRTTIMRSTKTGLTG